MNQNQAPALVIQNLVKRYKNGTEALRGVSLSVPRGDFFALLGPNGAGKTTILGTIVGLISKTSGSVSVFDYNIDREPEKARAQIGIVPQEMNFNPFETPLEIVVNEGGYYGIPRSVALPRAESLLQSLGLFEKRNQRSLTLSGGMKRRLMIARALIHRPKFLILDEPTAGVDVELRRGMWDFLQSLTAEGLTILLTTHYLEEAEQLCKHVAIINKGQIIAQGTMKEILSRLQKEKVLIDLARPIPESLLAALSSHGATKADATTIEIEIGEGAKLNDAILLLNERGFPIQSIRNKSGRLEEVFMNLTKES